MHQNPVDLPERTVIIKGRSGSYVYLTQRVKYSPELKQTRPVRVAIGKLDEEGRLKANKVKVNHIASYLFGDMMFSSIFGIALVARVVETDEGPDIAGIEDFEVLYNTLKGIAEKVRLL